MLLFFLSLFPSLPLYGGLHDCGNIHSTVKADTFGYHLPIYNRNTAEFVKIHHDLFMKWIKFLMLFFHLHHILPQVFVCVQTPNIFIYSKVEFSISLSLRIFRFLFFFRSYLSRGGILASNYICIVFSILQKVNALLKPKNEEEEKEEKFII